MKKNTVYFPWRFRFIVFLLCLVTLGLVWRMVDLTIIQRSFLRHQGNARTIRVIKMPAYRGMITDRNGEPLAISTPVQAVWINPKQFSASSAQIKQIAEILNIDVQSLQKRLQQNKNREFMYVKRQVDPNVAQKVASLQISGVHLKREFRRFYPGGEVSAQLVGLTNIDDQGQEGMELAYNQWLQGISGRKRVLKDRLGHIVEDIDIIREPTPGHNLVLSIDRRIQYLAYRALKEEVTKDKAISGSVVVLDVQTGEVLAMANVPSFNPNNRPDINLGRYRNRAITDVFEPGSTIKAFTIANGLASGLYTPNSIVDTSPGWMMLDGKRVHDPHDNGKINLATIIQRSSNMGATKITLSLPPKSLPTLLRMVGFGQRTTSEFPGESAGIVPYHKHWEPFTLATLSFGYGLSTTTLQLAKAYSVLASGGIERPISLLKIKQAPAGKRILSQQVADEVNTMLESVVQAGGTGTMAQVPGYRVAGKTGTSRIVGPTGYEKNHHNAIFVGMAPVSHPKLVVAVFIHDPQGRYYYGGLVAAPVFAQVMGGALRMLDISPDKLS